jgi:gliding motility-associated-like protein
MTYIWDFGDSSTSTLPDPVKVYDEAGRFKVTLIAISDKGCRNSFSMWVNVLPKPTAGFTFGPEDPLPYDSFVTFTNTSTRGVHYDWDFGNGVTRSTYKYGTMKNIYMDTGSFRVTLTATDSNGCADVYTQTVRIKPLYKCHIPNTFSPNRDNLNDYFRPECTYFKRYDLSIMDRWGEIIFTSREDEMDPAWDGKYYDRSVPDGNFVYLIRVVDFEDKMHVYKGIITVLH